MKDHVEERRRIELGYDAPVEEMILQLRKLAAGLVDAHVSFVWNADAYAVIGWRPMTEKELATAEKRRSAARIAANARVAKREAAERKTYEKLKAKYEGKS